MQKKKRKKTSIRAFEITRIILDKTNSVPWLVKQDGLALSARLLEARYEFFIAFDPLAKALMATVQWLFVSGAAAYILALIVMTAHSKTNTGNGEK